MIPAKFLWPDTSVMELRTRKKLVAAGWDESKHPREPQGTDKGGEFAPKVATEIFRGQEAGAAVKGLDNEVKKWPIGEPRKFAREALVSTPMAPAKHDYLYTVRKDGDLIAVASASWHDPEYVYAHYAGAIRGGGLPMFRAMLADAVANNQGLYFAAGTDMAKDLYDRMGFKKVPGGYLIPPDEAKLLAGDVFRYVREPRQKALAAAAWRGVEWPEEWWIPGPVEGVRAAGWDESKHRREPAGTAIGGEFATKESGVTITPWGAKVEGFEVFSVESSKATAPRFALYMPKTRVPWVLAPDTGVLYVGEGGTHHEQLFKSLGESQPVGTWAEGTADFERFTVEVERAVNDWAYVGAGEVLRGDELERIRRLFFGGVRAAGWEDGEYDEDPQKALTAAYVEAKHPRAPKGSAVGGEWVRKGTGTGFQPRPDADAVANANALWDSNSYLADRAKVDGLTPDEYLAKVDEHLAEQLFDAEVKIRTPTDLLDEIVTDGRFKSQFESGTSGGSLNTIMRSQAEERMFGYPEDLPVEQRPIYGYLHRPSKFEGEVDQYGDVTWELKRDVRDRVTWTGQDSLGSFLLPSKLTDPSHLSVRPPDSPTVSEWQPWNPAADPVEQSGANYREAQIHGGVTLDDVAVVTIPGAYRPYAEKGPAGEKEVSGLELRPTDPVWGAYVGLQAAVTKLKARGVTVEYSDEPPMLRGRSR